MYKTIKIKVVFIFLSLSIQYYNRRNYSNCISTRTKITEFTPNKTIGIYREQITKYYNLYDILLQWSLSNPTRQWNLSTLTRQWTRGMCRMGLQRILQYSGFILGNRNTLGASIFVGCHMMSENSGVGLHRFHCTIFLLHRFQDFGVKCKTQSTCSNAIRKLTFITSILFP